MIDFRYHLVSIVAVFLALAIGLVVGATSLQGIVVSGLQSAANQEKKTNDMLRAKNSALSKQITADEAFAAAGAGYLMSDKLLGEQVVVVTAPGADPGTVNGIIAALGRSGATVTAQVQLTSQFFDVSQATESALTSLSQQLAPAGSGLPSVSADQNSGQEAAAQVISYALMRKAGTAGASPQEIQSIISGFGSQGFLQVQNTSGGAGLSVTADLAVVVVPAVPAVPPNAGSLSNMSLVAMAQQLQKAGQGAIMAGSLAGSGPGSAIDLVNSGAAGASLSTVDDADTVMGQVTVVQALRQTLDPRLSPSAYGVGPGTAPSPAPSTPPSQGAAPSGSVSPGASPTPKRSVQS